MMLGNRFGTSMCGFFPRPGVRQAAAVLQCRQRFIKHSRLRICGTPMLSATGSRRCLSRAVRSLVQSSEIVQVGHEFYDEAGLERIQHFVPVQRGAQRPVSRQSNLSPAQQSQSGTTEDFADSALLSLVQIRQSDCDHSNAPVALLLHGAISNGKVFHSNKASGLAPFLARRGFNVFVGELRGRGGGVPSLQQEASQTRAIVPHGQFEAIRNDIPLLSDATQELSGQSQQSWIAHSWGGVLMSSALAFDHSLADRVTSLVCFGTKKDIATRDLMFYRRVGIVWTYMGPFLAKWLFGYLPMRRVISGAASDDETFFSLRDSNAWLYSSNWVDPSGASCWCEHLPIILF
eukprot:INCI14373.1.p1 GENE.INCI14373.1~~INCI14373.1.p1  ORF type:complete len:347 (+),score=32.77 INCI14373.1:127-1167(+)